MLAASKSRIILQMISALFGVGVKKDKEKPPEAPHKGVLRFDQRLLEQRADQQKSGQAGSQLVELILTRI